MRVFGLLLLTAALVASSAVGCGSNQRTATLAEDQATPDIKPLSEAEFDAFANRAASSIREFLRNTNAPLPAYISMPRIHASGVEDQATAAGFGRILADGLNDRLAGMAIFGPRKTTETDFVAELLFGKGKHDPAQRIVVVRLIDPRTREEFVNEGYAYRRGDAPPEQRLAADEIRLLPLTIDAPRDEIVQLAAAHAREFPGRVIEGAHGRVCFVSGSAQNGIWLQTQRATWTTSSNMRLVFEFRAKQRARLANLRLIMLDALENPVEVSPTIPYQFATDFTKPVHFNALHPHAEKYLLLVDLD